jgi:hypothetical protein
MSHPNHSMPRKQRLFRAAAFARACRRFVIVGLLLGAGKADAENSAGIEFFEQHVRPILATRCQKCHGLDKQESDLRLDSAAAALKGGVYGAAVVPGKPDESLLVSATSYKNDDLQMPPKGRLTDEEVSHLRRWVEIGAPWPDEHSTDVAQPFDLAARKASHWAWQRVQQPAVPSVRDEQWPRGVVDRFVLARLEERGLKPAPDADRRTLIRRAYLDLIGLLPTPSDVANFLADDSPDALERVIDRLLASPRFGERWARHWFDLVRYAETYGHEQDFAVPHAWQYRDYVIRSLNTDVPYDKFVMEHVAGDLIDPPRLNPSEGFNESIIGTGFWFMYEQTHAPTDIRQHEADRVDNQIDVMTKAFLGITVGCARCHDHKFDAISTRDYYALAGFLKSSRQQIALLDPRGQIDAAAVRLNKLRESGTKLLRDAIPPPTDAAGPEFARWLLAAREVKEGRSASDVAAQQGLNRERLSACVAALEAPEIKQVAHPLSAWSRLEKSPSENSTVIPSLVEQIRQIIADRKVQSARTWLLKRDGDSPFADWFYSGWAFGTGPGVNSAWEPSGESPAIVVSNVLDSGGLAKNLQGAVRSPTFVIPGPQLHVHVRGKGRARLVVDNYMLDEETNLLFGGLIVKFDTGNTFQWITIKGDLGKYVGERAYLSVDDDGSGAAAIDEAIFTDGPPPGDPPSTLLLSAMESGTDSPELLAAAYGNVWNETLKQWHADDLDAAHAELLNWVLRNNLIDTSAVAAKLAALRLEIRQADEALPAPMRVLAMTDGTGQDEHVYRRGKHQNLGDIEPRRFLEAVSGEDQPSVGATSGRLELARRMVDPTNPLFARTAVNRIWHHLFGRGIVPTVDNLGVQGEPATHPELLDWLADDFVQQGCSQKQLIRQLMLSRTYQMSSRPADPAGDEQDPANMLWHRANVRRLEGEAIRDCLLQVSGRLDETMFGPAVPAHLSAFSESKFSPKTSGPTDGDGRRSIYQEVRRNHLPQMLLAFDTPTPFTTVGRRNVSNVPAQALTMLNDPLVANLANRWAKQVLTDFADRPQRERIERMFETALCRLPTEAELAAAEKFIERQGELLGVPPADRDRDQAVWSDFAHVLFNDKEFVLRN